MYIHKNKSVEKIREKSNKIINEQVGILNNPTKSIK